MPEEVTLLHDDIEDLVPDMAGCIATDYIAVEGEPVGFMFRAEPQNSNDSGWRFFAGSEDDAYMADDSNHAVYDVNTIANHDRDIIAHLQAPVGAAFARNESGVFVAVQDSD